ncbi:hypothetical protein GCM10023221_19550 [Luteimicrobium xylanilyticum]|uniref:Uncharacterized protein n=1 Tax=Luteimicrobium xylanilyticum TaxID=1133546 RepID=A0A5P9Q6T5_9MICO|nr:hypothetical protein [Luteimicrobium xylanilyticum]QFU97111.1 hypothetical protein KDY119_00605 [Luteimicrobium xylanilyticum]
MVGVLEAVIPSIAVGLIFWLVMRFVVRADRNERNAMAALWAQEDRETAEKRTAHSGPPSNEGAESRQNV